MEGLSFIEPESSGNRIRKIPLKEYRMKKDGAGGPVLFVSVVSLRLAQGAMTSNELDHTEASHGQGECPP